MTQSTQTATQTLTAQLKPLPRVTVLCGSTRFKDEFERVEKLLTFQGHIVLTVGLFGHADNVYLTPDAKAALDELHLRKIDLADEVFVINPGFYVGDSTKLEIVYAKEHAKPIRFLQLPSTLWGERPEGIGFWWFGEPSEVVGARTFEEARGWYREQGGDVETSGSAHPDELIWQDEDRLLGAPCWYGMTAADFPTQVCSQYT